MQSGLCRFSVVPIVRSAQVEGSRTTSGFWTMFRLHLRASQVSRLYRGGHFVGGRTFGRRCLTLPSCQLDTEVVRLPPDPRDSHQARMNLALSACLKSLRSKHFLSFSYSLCSGKGSRRATLALTTRLQ